MPRRPKVSIELDNAAIVANTPVKGTFAYWNAKMTETAEAMLRGEITSTEAERRNRVFLSQITTLAQLRILKANGVPDDAEPEYDASPIKVAKPRTVVVKRGNTAKGPTDEVTSTFETVSPADEEIDFNTDLD